MSELPRPPFVAGDLLARVPRPAPIASLLPAVLDHIAQTMNRRIAVGEEDEGPKR